MAINIIKNFLKLEAKGSILLLLSALIAIGIANSPLNLIYNNLLNTPFYVPYIDLSLSIKQLVNDGLMTIFFLFISLELKREFLVGELKKREKALLPIIASMSGMLVAALVFLFINAGNMETKIGWAIPTATDVAFASAVVLLLGRAIPTTLKTFIIALAITDDLGAILIISLFYTHDFQIVYLLLSMLCFLIMILINISGTVKYFLYVIVGVLLWVFALKSHINPPLSGVLIGFAIPMYAKDKSHSPLQLLEEKLHPWVVFGILPLFALANASLNFSFITFNSFLHPLTLGIALGLIFGKQIGVFVASYLAVNAKLAKLPSGATWRHMYGISVLCGVGFTMNLFIGTLAFSDHAEYLNLVKLGIFCAALVSGVVGYLILRRAKSS